MAETPSCYLSTAETAKATGLTPRALRLYERRGLLSPQRTASGWRVYGPDALARLHQILALKHLGLSLEMIGKLVAGRASGLSDILLLQEQALVERRDAAARGVALVKAARERLETGGELSLDELTTLIKETTMTEQTPEWAKRMAPIVDRHFSADDRKGMAEKAGPFDQHKAQADWAALIEEAQRLVGSDPAAPEAVDLARRWRDQVRLATSGDPALNAKIGAVWKEALADPAVAPSLPFGPEVMQFIAEASRRLPK